MPLDPIEIASLKIVNAQLRKVLESSKPKHWCLNCGSVWASDDDGCPKCKSRGELNARVDYRNLF